MISGEWEAVKRVLEVNWDSVGDFQHSQLFLLEDILTWIIEDQNPIGRVHDLLMHVRWRHENF